MPTIHRTSDTVFGHITNRVAATRAITAIDGTDRTGLGDTTMIIATNIGTFATINRTCLARLSKTTNAIITLVGTSTTILGAIRTFLVAFAFSVAATNAQSAIRRTCQAGFSTTTTGVTAHIRTLTTIGRTGRTRLTNIALIITTFLGAISTVQRAVAAIFVPPTFPISAEFLVRTDSTIHWAAIAVLIPLTFIIATVVFNIGVSIAIRV
jgi:hypothetical protein